MPHTTLHAYHHDLARVVEALRVALDRRTVAVLSGPCIGCLTSAWMSAIHPTVCDGWSVGVIAPSSLQASVEYNAERGLNVDEFMEHVIPSVLVLNAAADEAEDNVDPTDSLSLQERFIRGRRSAGVATLLLTHRPYTDLDPDLLTELGDDFLFLRIPQQPPNACTP